MLTHSHILIVGLLASGTAFALPGKPPVSQYRHLSEASPFTNPPVVPGPVAKADPFQDWALGGVSEVEGGYMVTLVNTKNQGETQIIKPRGTVHSTKDEMKWIDSGAPGSIKVDHVEFGKESWKDTIVMVSSGDDKGTMRFDDKQLSPAAAATPAGGVRPPGQPGQPVIPNPTAAHPAQSQPAAPSTGRPPRQRVQPTAPNTQSRPTR